MQEVFKMIERVADTDSTILILGESGTGKELVARALHFNSRRQFAPFIPINCSALPENLLESELFGHCKGRVHRARSTTRRGFFRRPTAARSSWTKSARCPRCCKAACCACCRSARSGAWATTPPLYVNVRVLSATNEPLEERVKAGSFREDLYYRLNVIPINLPNLRERREDIPVLTVHFLRNKINPRTGKLFQITRKALEVLSAHDWPGNVRELENAIERACALCEDGTIKVADLPPIVRRQAPATTARSSWKFPKPGARGSVRAGDPACWSPESTGHPMSQPLGPLKDFLRSRN
jgi:DNA-binding NtrC family response regulator